LLWNGYDIRAVQERLGPEDVAITMIYAHVCNKPGLNIHSPVDEPSLPSYLAMIDVKIYAFKDEHSSNSR
jgi:hypothetical protein